MCRDRATLHRLRALLSTDTHQFGRSLMVKYMKSTIRIVPLTHSWAANLRGFRASEAGSQILGMESQILGTILIHFNVVHKKLHWWNPNFKSLNSMPASQDRLIVIVI